jgi:uncharacterized membrane protein YeaQ/YmgE (transglycosylase-associated protein family)
MSIMCCRPRKKTAYITRLGAPRNPLNAPAAQAQGLLVITELWEDPGRVSLRGQETVGILSWIVIGLIAGALAKWIMPGDDPGGVIVTTLIGVGGGLLGGFIGTRLGIGAVTGFNLVSLGLAVGGAVVLLFGYRLVKR